MRPGEVITRRMPPISQDQIDRWGELVGTSAAIHSDPEFAEKTPHGGVIAQGMLVLAPLHHIMLELVGSTAWHASGRVSAKMINITRPGDEITYEITVSACSDSSFVGEYRCLRTDGAVVIVGTVSSQARLH